MRNYIYEGKQYQFADDAVPDGAVAVDAPVRAEPVKEKAKAPTSNKAKTAARNKGGAK